MYTGERQAARIRWRYVRALVSQEVGFFDAGGGVSTGEVVAGIAADTILLQEAVGSKVTLKHQLDRSTTRTNMPCP
jgi:ATP-binding cassette subfamily B (MDR/TAP) protein 1